MGELLGKLALRWRLVCGKFLERALRINTCGEGKEAGLSRGRQGGCSAVSTRASADHKGHASVEMTFRVVPR